MLQNICFHWMRLFTLRREGTGLKHWASCILMNVPVFFDIPRNDNDLVRAMGAKFDWGVRAWYSCDDVVIAKLANRWVQKPAVSGEMRTLYFDTETNGIGSFRPATQRLVQLAWEFDGTEGDSLIDDVEEINPEVPHPHSVKSCAANGVGFFSAMAPFVTALRQCDTVVAHNLDFDQGVLQHEYQQRGADFTEIGCLLRQKGICTMKRTVQLCRLPSKHGNGYKWPRLEELYNVLTGETPQLALHDALNDVKVMKRCHDILCERGYTGLARGHNGTHTACV